MSNGTFFLLALWSAVAPQTLAVELYLLGGEKGLRRGWTFVAGLMFTSLVAGALVAWGMGDLGIHVGQIGGGRRFPVAYMVIGALLIAFAVYIVWRHVRADTRPTRAARVKESSRLDHLVGSGWVALGVGLLFGMPGIPYALALAGAEDRPPIIMAAAIVVFSIITNVCGWAPAVWCSISGQKALGRLASLRAAAGRHHVVIIAAVLAVVGAYLVVFGIVTAS